MALFNDVFIVDEMLFVFLDFFRSGVIKQTFQIAENKPGHDLVIDHICTGAVELLNVDQIL